MCRHCERTIVKTSQGWIDPEATADDEIWRETCDAHDTFIADHEPTPGEPNGDTPEQDYKVTLTGVFTAASEEEAREAFVVWTRSTGYAFDGATVTKI